MRCKCLPGELPSTPLHNRLAFTTRRIQGQDSLIMDVMGPWSQTTDPSTWQSSHRLYSRRYHPLMRSGMPTSCVIIPESSALVKGPSSSTTASRSKPEASSSAIIGIPWAPDRLNLIGRRLGLILEYAGGSRLSCIIGVIQLTILIARR